MIFITQERNKQKPQGICLPGSQGRRSAAYGRKTILETEKQTEPKPGKAKSCKAESQPGEPGLPEVLKANGIYRS